MTSQAKHELISRVIELLESSITIEGSESKESSENPIEMLTVKECTQKISGLSEHTVRLLIAQDKIPYIRVGEGKRGKILIPKSALLEYLKIMA